MAECSCHHEQVKNLMRAEMHMLFIKDMQLQGIDHTANRIQDASDKEPEESPKGQTSQDGRKKKDRKPAHPDIDRR